MDQKRLVLLVSILASFVPFLDSSVINVALPAISRDLGGGLLLQQWVVDAYLITLGSLILIAGSLADVFGQRRIMRYGLWGFAATSLLCAIAPNGVSLIIFRALQGVAGAILVPASLSLIIAAFPQNEQGAAIGSWTAWTGISFLFGPIVGGSLIDAASWRLIFVITIIPVIAALWLMRKFRDAVESDRTRSIDYLGAVLCSCGLFAVVFALIEEPLFSWHHPAIYLSLLLGAAALVAFLINEHSKPDPMLPLSLFRVRNFLFGNIATFAIYAALSIATFLIAIFLQQVAHYSALLSGLALIPVTLIMFFLSPRFGLLSNRYGPRLFMSTGPLVAALGFFLMSNMTLPVDYWRVLLPDILIFGLGLSTTVAPLTAAVLGSIDSHHSGIGSAVNNAVARIAGLIAIALIGVFIGQDVTVSAFHAGALLSAGLLILGGIISFIGIRDTHKNGGSQGPAT